MCLIVYKPEGCEIPSDLLANAHSSNHDGFGLFFADPKTKKVRVIKGLFKIDQIKYVYSRFANHSLAMHFRMGTHGEISNINSHPYRITSLEKEGRDLWLCHNGILSHMDAKRGVGRSDSREFAEDYLHPILRKDPKKIDDPEFRELVGSAIGSYNKLLIMSGEGEVFIINKNSGQEDKGVWYSNGMYRWSSGYYGHGYEYYGE